MSTTDGYHYTSSTGLTQGLPSRGVISPSKHQTDPDSLYDVIVIGAGYAGLIASRDLTLQGHKVLLLEARDRIGGRTWTADVEGFPYEMGGTWIHWNQPHVYREISRYNIADQIAISQDFEGGVNRFTFINDGVRRDMSHDEEDALFNKALRAFCDVDGQLGRTVIPFPHNPMHSTAAVLKYDKLSCLDRVSQIRAQLSPDELTALESMLLHIGGGTLDNIAFFDVLRWWALSGYCASGINEYGLKYKFKAGQSSFASLILSEARETGKLGYHFGFPVASVNDVGYGIEVTGRSGVTFIAKRLISTLPLNVLKDVVFTPALSALKSEAAQKGHVDMASKVHYEVSTPSFKSWTGTAYPGKGLLYAYGDGVTPAGHTHIVAFGAEAPVQLHGEEDIEATKGALEHFNSEMEIRRVVWHNWTKDEWAKGAWCVFSPGFASKYAEELQQEAGRVHFASGDWAVGWRGFIDGAIEQGARAAVVVAGELRRRVESRTKL